MSDDIDPLLGASFEASGFGAAGPDCDIYVAVETEVLQVDEHDDGVVNLRFIGDSGAEVSIAATPDRLADLTDAIAPHLPDDPAVLPGENADPELNKSDLPTADAGPPHADEAEELFDPYSADSDGVIAALEDHGGEVPQADFTDLLDTYQSKVSILLSDMEADGVIEREITEGRGTAKVVRLPDDHDASADPDEDAADASEHDPELEDLHTDPQDETAGADPPATTNTEPEHLDPDDPEDLQQAYNEADNLSEVARRFPMGRTAIMQRLAAHGILDESDRETGVNVQSLDLSQYGQSGQVVTPEMLIEALDGAQALYHVKRDLRLADREIEDICRHLDLLEDLRNGTGKLDRPTVEAAVWQAVET